MKKLVLVASVFILTFGGQAYAAEFVASPGVKSLISVVPGDTIRTYASKGSVSCQVTPQSGDSKLALSLEIAGPSSDSVSDARFTGLMQPVVTGDADDSEGKARVSFLTKDEGYYTLSVESTKDDASEVAELACYNTMIFAPYNSIPGPVRHIILELYNFSTDEISGTAEIFNSAGEQVATKEFSIPKGSPVARTRHIIISGDVGRDFGVIRVSSDAPLNALRGWVAQRGADLSLVGPKRRFRLAPNNR